MHLLLLCYLYVPKSVIVQTRSFLFSFPISFRTNCRLWGQFLVLCSSSWIGSCLRNYQAGLAASMTRLLLLQLIDVGCFVCLDSFLSLLTVMPTRLIMICWRFLKTRFVSHTFPIPFVWSWNDSFGISTIREICLWDSSKIIDHTIVTSQQMGSEVFL